MVDIRSVSTESQCIQYSNNSAILQSCEIRLSYGCVKFKLSLESQLNTECPKKEPPKLIAYKKSRNPWVSLTMPSEHFLATFPYFSGKIVLLSNNENFDHYRSIMFCFTIVTITEIYIINKK